MPLRSPGTATIPVLVVLAVVMALGASVVLFEYSKARLISLAGEYLALMASETADKLTLLMSDRYGHIQMLSDNLSSRDGAALRAHVHSMEAAYPLYSSIVVTDETGRIVAATNDSNIGRDESSTPAFQTLRKRGGIYLEGFPAQGTNVKSGGIIFSARLQGRTGEFQGIVKTTVPLQTLRETFDQTVQTFQAKLRQQDKIEYELIADNGDVLLGSAPEGRTNLQDLGIPSVLLSSAGQSGYVEEQSLARYVSVITGYAHTGALKGLPGLGWSVLIREDRATVLAPLYALLWQSSLVAVVVVLPLLGLIVWAMIRLRHDWINTRQMLECQAAILDRIQEGVLAVDTNGVITFMNRTAELLTGWTRQDAVSRRLSDIYIVVDEKTRQRIRDPLATATQEGPLASRERRVFLVARDGTEKAIVQIGSPIKRHNGDSLGVAFTFHDTSRHRTALPKFSLVNPEP